jgi:pimeloyl-ACP methyl ester carboxylesterase
MHGLGRRIRAVLLALTLLVAAESFGAEEKPERVSFATADGGTIYADLYGSGTDAVVLAHGAVFDKESWEPLAEALAGREFLVLALDFRGYGDSKPGREQKLLYLDVLGAIDFLDQRGASRISLVGASMGGYAAGRAASESRNGQLSTVVLLAPGPIPEPETMKAERFVFIVSEDEPGVDRVRRLYSLAPEPKTLEILATGAHAQHVFATEQGPRLTELITANLRQ